MMFFNGARRTKAGLFYFRTSEKLGFTLPKRVGGARFSVLPLGLLVLCVHSALGQVRIFPSPVRFKVAASQHRLIVTQSASQSIPNKYSIILDNHRYTQ